MSRFPAVCFVLSLLAWAGIAHAHVTAGATCANCHSPDTGRQTITTPLTTNATADPGVTTGLPLFVAHPGNTITLPISVIGGGTASGDAYAVALTKLTSATTEAGLIKPSDILSFVQDPAWTARGSGTNSYATRGPFSWTGTTTDYGYTMTISASTPSDYYRLNLTATGVDSNIGMWTQSQDFVIRVTPVPEPASITAMGVSLGLFLLGRRRHI